METQFISTIFFTNFKFRYIVFLRLWRLFYEVSFAVFSQPSNAQFPHLETSQLIYFTDECTGFHTIKILVKGIRDGKLFLVYCWFPLLLPPPLPHPPNPPPKRNQRSFYHWKNYSIVWIIRWNDIIHSSHRSLAFSGVFVCFFI